MTDVINFRKLIEDLEDKKWTILLEKGDQAALLEWPKLDARLAKLYRWWAKDAGRHLSQLLKEQA